VICNTQGAERTPFRVEARGMPPDGEKDFLADLLGDSSIK